MREYTDGKYYSTISFVKLINTTHDFVIESTKRASPSYWNYRQAGVDVLMLLWAFFCCSQETLWCHNTLFQKSNWIVNSTQKNLSFFQNHVNHF